MLVLLKYTKQDFEIQKNLTKKSTKQVLNIPFNARRRSDLK